jgi:conjugal transfer/entry exclusion protein
MRMLEICESERSLIQEDINNERGDIQSLIEQLKIYDNLINEVNENSLAILGRYKDFMNREIVND